MRFVYEIDSSECYSETEEENQNYEFSWIFLFSPPLKMNECETNIV